MNKYISGIRPKIGIPNFPNILAYDEAWGMPKDGVGLHQACVEYSTVDEIN